jgi:hypothetical protein
MVTAATGTGARRAWQPSFFFWMTVAMAVLVCSGFALTYWQPLLTGNLNPLPPVVHLHGLFYFGWMVLLLVQPAMVGAGNLTMHRSLGSFGIAIATGVLITGTLLTLLFGNAYPTDTPNYYDFTYLGYAAVLLFGVLFTLAIRQTRQPDNHRRLMLLATIPLLPPGINRLYQVSLNLAEAPVLAPYLTMDVLLAAIFAAHHFKWIGQHGIGFRLRQGRDFGLGASLTRILQGVNKGQILGERSPAKGCANE